MSEQIPNLAPQQPPAEVRVPVTLHSQIKKPMVTYILLGVTVFFFILQYISQYLTGGSYDWPYILGGKINEFILRGQVWRLITPVLLHGSLVHIGFNMYALYSIGPSLEKHYGHLRFLLLYFIAGFAGNALSFVFSPNPSLGASTAVFGLVAAETVFIIKNQKMFGSRARSMIMNLGLVIAVNFILGLSTSARIDNWGHLGGLIGGLLFAWFAGPVYKVQAGGVTGYELKDTRNKEQIIWGCMVSIGLFAAVVIGRMFAG